MVAGICAGLVVIAALASLVAPGILNKTPHVHLYVVQSTALQATIAGGGLTYPVQSLDVGYPVSAVVLGVNVQVGQAVTKGQTLIRLDNSQLSVQLQQAYQQWQNAVNYLDSLYADGATSTTISSAQQQAADAKAAYDALQTLLSSPTYKNGNIVAPFSAVVTAVNVTPGTNTNAGSTLISIADLSTIIVKAQFPIEDLSLLRLNQQATVVPAATPGQTFTGTVSTLNPILTSAGADTFEVWISVPNPSKLLFGNESVFARVQTTETLPTVPELAVVNPDGESIVFLYQNGRAHLVHVTVVVHDGDQLGISTGLNPGDQVILVGQYQLHDNEAVVVS